eukprot:3048086-Prymnesium_polylepis.1
MRVMWRTFRATVRGGAGTGMGAGRERAGTRGTWTISSSVCNPRAVGNVVYSRRVRGHTRDGGNVVSKLPCGRLTPPAALDAAAAALQAAVQAKLADQAAEAV